MKNFGYGIPKPETKDPNEGMIGKRRVFNEALLFIFLKGE